MYIYICICTSPGPVVDQLRQPTTANWKPVKKLARASAWPLIANEKGLHGRLKGPGKSSGFLLLGARVWGGPGRTPQGPIRAFRGPPGPSRRTPGPDTNQSKTPETGPQFWGLRWGGPFSLVGYPAVKPVASHDMTARHDHQRKHPR